MNNLFRTLKKKDVGSIGIGAMIVFIAMVLVAGIAASVLIQTSTKLESQAMATGHQTTDEVSSGIAIFDIEGYADTASDGDLSLLAIMVRPRAGTDGVDLEQTYIELADANTKVVLNYSTTFFSDPDGQADIFSAAVFPDTGLGGNPGSEFGILVMEDADDSVAQLTPVINRGDKVFLCINTSVTHGEIAERIDVWGLVVPELGSPGVISFRTPASYTDDVFDLQ
jgi:flagellin FlaB